MSKPFRAIKISDHVYWVGAVDWSIRDFHGYSTNRGTTYNAYLIMADKLTLIDTVKAPFRDELLSRIASIVNPHDISYLISNHSEMDHSGCLPEIIEEIKPEKVFASVMGVKTLSKHFGLTHKIAAVKDGETIDLGNMSLFTIETRMLHWPDSMFTYLAEDGVLFSQDAFGMHLASSERFADEISNDILEWEAAKYYANILLPFSPLVTKLYDRIGTLDLAFRIVAPDHGPMWRQDIDMIMGLYRRWAEGSTTKKAVIVYDSMWGSTAKMARAIEEGLSTAGVSVRALSLSARHRSDVATELLDAGALLVGSPTLNNNMYPTIADVMTYLRGLKPRTTLGAAFGSYGWSGEAVGQLNEVLTGMAIDTVGDGLKVQYVPNDEELNTCRSLGVHVAERLKEVVNREQ